MQFDFAHPALLAYGSQPVRNLVEKLEKTLNEAYTIEARIQLSRLAKLEQEHNDALDRGDFEVAKSLRGQISGVEVALNLRAQMSAYEEAISSKSPLDVDALQSLCDRILEAARKDLRGI